MGQEIIVYRLSALIERMTVEGETRHGFKSTVGLLVGIINTPITVPINSPPAAPVPIDRFPAAPTPLANTNGINPKIKAKEVIKIGRKRTLAPSMAALVKDIPSLRR